MADIYKQCEGGKLKYGGINNRQVLEENLKQNCIPNNIGEMDQSNYEQFLELRRKLIAQKIKNYYFVL